ncbi:MAG: tRNA (adenosine(37)-N6)-threonylcarbamoyltransferase complex dimerization subunit type 1 TsaB [Fibrobacter sp.]|nr:tRNA (adenosine(37)-N6)-threonylcarbamoyltransferase complex dimerization subunit type 1 TsaB [Fibrobacter sp.]
MELDLVLDTSRKGIALGIYDAGKPLCEHFEPETRGENLGNTLDSVLERAKVSLDDIKRVMVTLGPGSFTGLRTGIAFCEGLCFSGKRSLYGISTLKALRSLSSDENVAVVLYARTGFFYVGTQTGEFFIPVEEAVQKFEDLHIRSFVADPRSAEEELLKSFVQKENAELLVSEGNEIAPFCKFFAELKPSIVQSANYIQPSYYERRGAQGVIR